MFHMLYLVLEDVVHYICLLQNDVIDCDISTIYPVGFTDCNIHDLRAVAHADCGKFLKQMISIVLRETISVSNGIGRGFDWVGG